MAPFNHVTDPWYINPALPKQFKQNLREAMSLLGENRERKRKIRVKFDRLIAELVHHHARTEHHEANGAANDNMIEEHREHCDCLCDDDELARIRCERKPQYMDSQVCDSIERRVQVRDPHIGEHQHYHLNSSIRLQEELRKVFNDIKSLRDLAVETQTIISTHTAPYEFDPEPYSEPDCLDCQSSPPPRMKNPRKRAISDTAAGSKDADVHADKRRKTI
ncbi:hypothetical protein CERSUDRAFT_94246 [Gelatoporia subvermispora B]|uniref:Uncharacterized protein n=1 Tax=Ceriporiopsis subvermispora (strain B) TaxID=914234 RepID=M2PQ89_CERS8|nr:hypothetical protein CERSUDRAFT_94246 [Gelatoporia subvermispora B]